MMGYDQLKPAHIWVIGDSLNDTGTFSGVSMTGRFTNTPGLLWTEIVARRYGTTVSPAYLFDDSTFHHTGGNNYAQSGACIQQAQGLFHGHSWSVHQQLDRLRTEGKEHLAGSLLLMDGGGPDILSAVMSVSHGQIRPDEGKHRIVTAARQAAELVLQATQEAFECVVWASVADFGRIPALGAGSGPTAALGRELSLTFNTTFDQAIGTLPASLIVVDLLTLFDEWITHFDRYGLKNVTEPGIDQEQATMTPTGNAANANASHHVQPDAPYTYLFADAIHPSARGHELIAEAVLQHIQSSP